MLLFLQAPENFKKLLPEIEVVAEYARRHDLSLREAVDDMKSKKHPPTNAREAS